MNLVRVTKRDFFDLMFHQFLMLYSNHGPLFSVTYRKYLQTDCGKKVAAQAAVEAFALLEEYIQIAKVWTLV